jgi:hypothetical protein
MSVEVEIVRDDVRMPTDFFLELAKGNIPGHSQVNKFGENPDITAGTTEDVWDGGGTYSFPTTASITHIKAAVNSAATRGLAVEVQGLSESWVLKVETVTLNAADSSTEVALPVPLRRVFRMKVVDNTVADQDIWVGPTGVVAGTANGIIQAGNNQTLMAIYTVPAGKTAYMTKYYAGDLPDNVRTPDSVEFRLWIADRGKPHEFQVKHMRGVPLNGDGFEHDFKPYLMIPEKSDIKISAEVFGGVGDDGHPHAGFDLILVDKDY